MSQKIISDNSVDTRLAEQVDFFLIDAAGGEEFQPELLHCLEAALEGQPVPPIPKVKTIAERNLKLILEAMREGIQLRAGDTDNLRALLMHLRSADEVVPSARHIVNTQSQYSRDSLIKKHAFLIVALLIVLLWAILRQFEPRTVVQYVSVPTPSPEQKQEKPRANLQRERKDDTPKLREKAVPKSENPVKVSGLYEGIAASKELGQASVSIQLLDSSDGLSGKIRSGGGDIRITGGSYTGNRLVIKFNLRGVDGTIIGNVQGNTVSGNWEMANDRGTIWLRKTAEEFKGPQLFRRSPNHLIPKKEDTKS